MGRRALSVCSFVLVLAVAPAPVETAPLFPITLEGEGCFSDPALCAQFAGPWAITWVLQSDGTFVSYWDTTPIPNPGTWTYVGGQLTLLDDPGYVVSGWRGTVSGGCINDGRWVYLPHDGIVDGVWSACVVP